MKIEFTTPPANYKPIDFGMGGITGSIDYNGRLLALNSYHPQHGYVMLTSADPFAEVDRYNPEAVQTYRANLIQTAGSGFIFDKKIVSRGVQLVGDAVPFVWLVFEDESEANVTTFTYEDVVVRRWQFTGDKPRHWGGRLSLQRSAYTQLVEDTPLPPALIETVLHYENGVLTIENPALGCAAAIKGLPITEPWDLAQADSVELSEYGEWQADQFTYEDNEINVVHFYYALGATADEARAKVLSKDTAWAHRALRIILERWKTYLENVPESLLVRRGLVYGYRMATPVGEGMCLLSDHLLLPLTSNEEAYYMAKVLLGWHPDMQEIVRRHLIWLFEIAERPGGGWARTYLANGQAKDATYILDQQLYPLLELCDYMQATGDQMMWERLKPQIAPIINTLWAQGVGGLIPQRNQMEMPYRCASHLLLWQVLRGLTALGLPYDDLANMVETTMQRFILQADDQPIYAYAIDGQGGGQIAPQSVDLPLALAPAWGLILADDPAWRNAAELAISTAETTPPLWRALQKLIVARATGMRLDEAAAWATLEKAAAWDGALPETDKPIARYWFAPINMIAAGVALGCFNP